MNLELVMGGEGFSGIRVTGSVIAKFSVSNVSSFRPYAVSRRTPQGGHRKKTRDQNALSLCALNFGRPDLVEAMQ